MGIFPKLVLLKGSIIDDPKLVDLLKSTDSLCGYNVCHYLLGAGLNIANSQLICHGEGPADTYQLIVINDLDKLTAIKGINLDGRYAQELVKFFSN